LDADLRWAAKTLLELNKIPAGPKYLAAFENPTQSQEWILMLVKGAAPAAQSMVNPSYTKALEILKQHGIKINPYSN
jgi:hypothetical protein